MIGKKLRTDVGNIFLIFQLVENTGMIRKKLKD